MSSTDTGVTKSTGFGTTDIERRSETAATAAAATAQAMIQSQFIMAMRNPRDWDLVRQRILKECDRPSFAREAIYHKPIGKGITGLSIRFAEVAVRCMGNLAVPTTTILDDDYKRIVNQSVVDLESNVHYSRDITINKTVERLSVKDGETVLSRRTNAQGQQTFTISASEDALLNKEGALVSKALRTLVLRLLPGDIQSEARERVGKTMNADIKKDPDGQKRAILDAFFVLGIKPAQLKELLAHDMDALSTDELTMLRALHNAIRDGETSIKEAIDNAKEQRGEKVATSEAGTKGVSSAAATLLQKVKPADPVIAEGGEAPDSAPAPAEKAQRGQPPKCKSPFECKNKLTSPVEKELNMCSDCQTRMTTAIREKNGTAAPDPKPLVPLGEIDNAEHDRLKKFSERARDTFLADNDNNMVAANKALETLSEGGCKNFAALPLYLRENPNFERVIEEAIS